MFVRHNPSTVASIGAPLSWGLEVGQPKRTLYVSGLVGTDAAGTVADDFLTQTKLIWDNLGAVLGSAGMTSANVVRTGIFVTPAVQMTPDVRLAFNALRTDFLGDNRPASTMICVHALMHPSWLIEIDAVAVEL